jgi:hypothetical protein
VATGLTPPDGCHLPAGQSSATGPHPFPVDRRAYAERVTRWENARFHGWVKQVHGLIPSTETSAPGGTNGAGTGAIAHALQRSGSNHLQGWPVRDWIVGSVLGFTAPCPWAASSFRPVG